jgi:hypothetical protein
VPEWQSNSGQRPMQSPFLIPEAEAEVTQEGIDASACSMPEAALPEIDPQDLRGIERLCEEIKGAQAELEEMRKACDAMKKTLLDKLDEIGHENVTAGAYKTVVKLRKSGWVYSDATKELEAKLKRQKGTEERLGIAVAGKQSRWAEVHLNNTEA